MGTGFLLGGKCAVAIGIEDAKDGIVGLFAVAVLENTHVCIFGNDGADTPGELNWTVMRIVVANESTDKTDQDVRGRYIRGRRGRLGPENRAIFCPQGPGQSERHEGRADKDRADNDPADNRITDCSEQAHAGSCWNEMKRSGWRMPKNQELTPCLSMHRRSIRFRATPDRAAAGSKALTSNGSRTSTRRTVYTRLSSAEENLGVVQSG